MFIYVVDVNVVFQIALPPSFHMHDDGSQILARIDQVLGTPLSKFDKHYDPMKLALQHISVLDIIHSLVPNLSEQAKSRQLQERRRCILPALSPMTEVIKGRALQYRKGRILNPS
jgi:hypothetical protein